MSITGDIIPCRVKQLVQFAFQGVGFFILHGFSENTGMLGMLGARSKLVVPSEQMWIVRLGNDGVVHVELGLFVSRAVLCSIPAGHFYKTGAS